MFWLILEAFIALLLFIGIVWFTVRGARKNDEE